MGGGGGKLLSGRQPVQRATIRRGRNRRRIQEELHQGSASGAAGFEPSGDAGKDNPTNRLLGHPKRYRGGWAIDEADDESGVGEGGEEGGKQERDFEGLVCGIPVSGLGVEAEPLVGGYELKGEGEGPRRKRVAGY